MIPDTGWTQFLNSNFMNEMLILMTNYGSNFCYNKVSFKRLIFNENISKQKNDERFIAIVDIENFITLLIIIQYSNSKQIFGKFVIKTTHIF